MISVKSLLNLQVYVRLPSKHVHVLRERDLLLLLQDVNEAARSCVSWSWVVDVVLVDIVVGLGHGQISSRDEENALRIAESIHPHRRLDAIVACPLARRGRRKSGITITIELHALHEFFTV